MRLAEYDWKTLVDLGAAAIVDGLQGSLARSVDQWLITPVFGDVLRADGLDPACPMTVRRAAPPFYVFVGGDSVMTCEDYEERNGSGAFDKAAHQFAALLASRPIRALARLLPQDVRKAIVTVLLTVANVLRK